MCPETFNLRVTAESILSWRIQLFRMNVSAGIAGEYLVGPHVWPHRLTGNHCWDFLLYDLPRLLEDVPLTVRARMWYVHNCDPAHFNSSVRGVLSNTYHDRWIGRGGHTAWPPRSPHLNPLDFCLLYHPAALVHVAPIDNEAALHHWIVDAFQTISIYPGIFELIRRSMTKR
jgi:hypothetical protein